MFSNSAGTANQNLTDITSPSNFFTLSFQYTVPNAASLTSPCSLRTAFAIDSINTLVIDEDSQTGQYNTLLTNFSPGSPSGGTISGGELVFRFECAQDLTLYVENVSLIAQTPASYNNYPSS